jgi:cyclic pyranopterin phosphate synthase
MDEAMIAATALGVKVKANIVISGEGDIDRGLRLLDSAPQEAHVRFQADTSDREPSLRAIYKLMRELGARPVARTVVAGCSIDNYDYETPEGRLVTFKQTRSSRLPGVCDNCPVDKAGECHEGYYGIRFYKDAFDDFWLSPCIQKMDTAQRLGDFMAEGGLGEKVSNYRNQDFNRLQKQFASNYNEQN